MERIGSAKSESLNVKFTFESNLSNNSVFSEEIMINVFYIGNELITNLLKHSFPTVIGMTLNLEGNQLKLQLKHDGIALSQRDYIALSKETENLGLENIRYRLNIIKGDLTFQRNNTLGEINFLVSI
jgi:signal transduction histidine kinase